MDPLVITIVGGGGGWAALAYAAWNFVRSLKLKKNGNGTYGNGIRTFDEMRSYVLEHNREIATLKRDREDYMGFKVSVEQDLRHVAAMRRSVTELFDFKRDTGEDLTEIFEKLKALNERRPPPRPRI